MSQAISSRVRYFFGFVSTALLVALALVAQFVGRFTAIKGLYALIGVLLAAAIWYQLRPPSFVHESITEYEFESAEPSARLDRWGSKAVACLVASAYLATYLTDQRLLPVLVASVVGFSLVLYQWMRGGVSEWLVAQVAALFTLGPVTRYLSTGLYFGSRDVLGHTRAVKLLLGTGRITSIDVAYSTYSSFPALHIASASVSAVSGLPAYDSLILLGTVAYLIATLALIYLVRTLVSPAAGVATGIVFATLSLVQTYASYFYPQAFATVIVVCFLYVLVREDSVPLPLRFPLSVVSVVSVVVLSLSHHVTQILFAGIVGVLFVPSVLARVGAGRRLGINERAPRAVPLLLALTAGLTYLSQSRFDMIPFFFQFASERARNPAVSDSGGIRTVFGFGTEIPYQGAWAAVRSLVYVDGLYFIGLSALFVVGVVLVLTRYERYAPITGYLLLGGLGSLFVLRTPLVNVARRLALPLSPFFSIVAGIGLVWIVSAVGSRLRANPSIRGWVRNAAVVGVVVMIAVTGPLVAADDLYGLHSGPNLWESYSTPEQQVDFSQQELRELEATVGHLGQYTSDVAMLSLTSDASTWLGGGEGSTPAISAGGIRTDDPLVYRTKWTEHQLGVTVVSGAPGTITIADWWLQREVAASNKLYTTGMVGMIEGEGETRLSASRADG